MRNRDIISEFQSRGGEYFIRVRRNGLWFAPGAALILLGLVALLVPQLVIAVVATLFFLTGLVVCAVGWKLLQFKRRFEKLAQQFEGKVFIQGVSVHPDAPRESAPEQKKIVFH